MALPTGFGAATADFLATAFFVASLATGFAVDFDGLDFTGFAAFAAGFLAVGMGIFFSNFRDDFIVVGRADVMAFFGLASGFFTMGAFFCATPLRADFFATTEAADFLGAGFLTVLFDGFLEAVLAAGAFFSTGFFASDVDFFADAWVARDVFFFDFVVAMTSPRSTCFTLGIKVLSIDTLKTQALRAEKHVKRPKIRAMQRRHPSTKTTY